MDNQIQAFVSCVAAEDFDVILKAHNKLHASWREDDMPPEEAALANLTLRAAIVEKGVRPKLIDPDLEERTLAFVDENPIFKTDSMVVADLRQEDVEIEKGIGVQLWGSPAGKSNIAKRLLPMFPEHKRYTELFFGGGACFWGKEKVAVEAVNDMDPNIPPSIKFVRDMTDEQIKKLQAMEWGPMVKEQWLKLKNSEPGDPLMKFYRFMRVRLCSFLSRMKTFSPQNSGGKSVPKKLERARERLKGVRVFHGSYADVIKKFDGPDAFHFLDPPYVKTRQDVGEEVFDHEEFWKILSELEGKFMVTYDLPAPDKYKDRGWTLIKVNHASNRGKLGQTGDYITYVTMNYRPSDEAIAASQKQAKKRPPAASPETTKEETEKRDVRLLPVAKAEEEKRIVFGVVLEPDEVDAQGDTISAEEIEEAAHLWLARFQNRGLMHRQLVNSQVEIFESYIAPADLTINGQRVKKGSWLLMYHILSDELWRRIKSGELTGFSMGGFARRVEQD